MNHRGMRRKFSCEMSQLRIIPFGTVYTMTFEHCALDVALFEKV